LFPRKKLARHFLGVRKSSCLLEASKGHRWLLQAIDRINPATGTISTFQNSRFTTGNKDNICSRKFSLRAPQ
jgi:hypothetical protein